MIPSRQLFRVAFGCLLAAITIPIFAIYYLEACQALADYWQRLNP
jgi:hypothetical protein